MHYVVKLHRYEGGDPKKLARIAEYNRIAIRVAAHLNEQAKVLAAGERKNVLSHTVAHAIGEATETVRRVIMSYEGGSNGMFIYGPSRSGGELG
jgi:hypothetical protein